MKPIERKKTGLKSLHAILKLGLYLKGKVIARKQLNPGCVRKITPAVR